MRVRQQGMLLTGAEADIDLNSKKLSVLLKRLSKKPIDYLKMFYADTVGLETVLCSIEQFARGHRGELWIPAPSLRTRAAEHGTFV